MITNKDNQVISITNQKDQSINLEVSTPNKAFELKQEPPKISWYDGKYEIDFEFKDITLPTKQLAMKGDIVIKAPKGNYGLVSYNGFELTIS